MEQCSVSGWFYYRNEKTGKMIAFFPNVEQLEFDDDFSFEQWLESEQEFSNIT